MHHHFIKKRYFNINKKITYYLNINQSFSRKDSNYLYSTEMHADIPQVFFKAHSPILCLGTKVITVYLQLSRLIESRFLQYCFPCLPLLKWTATHCSFFADDGLSFRIIGLQDNATMFSTEMCRCERSNFTVSIFLFPHL